MSDWGPPPSSPPQPPEGWQPGDVVLQPPTLRRVRWGIRDILIGVVVILAAALIATVLGILVVGLDGLESIAEGDLSGSDAAIVLGLSLIGQMGATGLWPIWVTVTRGNGPVADLGLWFRWIDLAIGPAIAIVMLGLAFVVNVVVSDLVGLDVDAAESSNTQIISDASGPSLALVIIAAVVLAPIVEELFFRGLCFRAIERRFGGPAAVVGSTVLFTLPHFTNPSAAGTAVLFSAIGVVGLVLGVLVWRTRRLGAAIVAHAVFNCVGVLAALAST